ncbi:hypothetical protein FRB95_009830 [Tulasnella sp. JGI-2019a]|nr:hypothetical protein FRB95_009830 [Tulasnella sp. JGI-2019a]
MWNNQRNGSGYFPPTGQSDYDAPPPSGPGFNFPSASPYGNDNSGGGGYNAPPYPPYGGPPGPPPIRSDSRPGVGSPAGPACPTCTFVNQYSATKCEMCHTALSRASSPPSFPGGGFSPRGGAIGMPSYSNQGYNGNPGGFNPGGSPPSGYGPPPGPPPSGFGPPPGPPPSHNARGANSGYPGENWGPNNGAPYRPPSGPPPNLGPQPFQYQPPSGPARMPLRLVQCPSRN